MFVHYILNQSYFIIMYILIVLKKFMILKVKQIKKTFNLEEKLLSINN